AWEAADPNTRLPRESKNLNGVHAASAKRTWLRSWIKRAYKAMEKEGLTGFPNLALNVGSSRTLVIDADTAEEVEAFQQWATELSGDARWHKVVPTVATPGAVDKDGNWKHRNGGHYWFTLPDGFDLDTQALPATLRIEHGNSSFVAMLHSAYVLIPPSARPEGEYRVVGPAMEAPGWLMDWLIHTTTKG